MRIATFSVVVTALVGASLVPAGSLAQANHLPAPGDLTVRLTPDGVRAPDSVRAGRYRLEFQGLRRRPSMLILVKPDRGYTRADLRRDDTSGSRAAARRIRQNIRFFGGVDVRPGQTGVLWETLYSGRYWLLTLGAPTRRGFDMKTVRVHGTPTASRFPRVAGDATTHRKTLGITRRIPRSGRLLVRNDSGQINLVMLLPLKRGISYREFLRTLRTGRGEQPFRLRGFRSTSLTSAGVDYVMRYRLRPGLYVAVSPLSLFGPSAPKRLRDVFRPVTVRGGQRAAAGAARYEADGFTSSPRQRRAVGRALERIATGRDLPEGLTPWRLLRP